MPDLNPILSKSGSIDNAIPNSGNTHVGLLTIPNLLIANAAAACPNAEAI